jgi:hypothetical protein
MVPLLHYYEYGYGSVQTDEKYMGFPVFKLRKRLVKRRSSKKKGGVDTQTADE